MAVAAIGFGLALALGVCGLVEGFFRLNKTYRWIKREKPVHPSFDPGRKVDLTGLDLDFLKKIVPYDRPHDYDDPDDYSRLIDLSKCSGRAPEPTPWIGAPNCDAPVVLRKKNSGRVVYSQTYHFDEHVLRKIPAAKPGLDKFLLFLGCSFTWGEGVTEEESFVNRITRAAGPVNAYNLGMGGYGPNVTLSLLKNGKGDLRLSGIRGTEGTAIYTFIDDHMPRVFASVNMIRRGHYDYYPYYDLIGDRLVEVGDFGFARPLTNFAYGLIAMSEALTFFNVDLPRYGDRQMRLFARIVAETRDLLEREFGVKRFVFSVFPGEILYFDRLKPFIEKEGIEIFDFSQLDIYNVLNGRHTLFGNGHPSPEAHRLYAELVARELSRPSRRSGSSFGSHPTQGR